MPLHCSSLIPARVIRAALVIEQQNIAVYNRLADGLHDIHPESGRLAAAFLGLVETETQHATMLNARYAERYGLTPALNNAAAHIFCEVPRMEVAEVAMFAAIETGQGRMAMRIALEITACHERIASTCYRQLVTAPVDAKLNSLLLALVASHSEHAEWVEAELE